jgi:hypothetical protein
MHSNTHVTQCKHAKIGMDKYPRVKSSSTWGGRNLAICMYICVGVCVYICIYMHAYVQSVYMRMMVVFWVSN